MSTLLSEVDDDGGREPAGEPVLLRSSFQRGVKHLPVRLVA